MSGPGEMEGEAMDAADVTLSAGAMGGQTGLWMLAVFLLGLATMAWLTVREASLYETRTAIKNLRKQRRHKFPAREELSPLSRMNLFIRRVIRGGEILEVLQEFPAAAREEYEARLRREIDKLVGKQVYHGGKEQLKPPTRPTSD
ncbi:MAG: hypothetical protein JF616_12185 [Fibrobacteres bacterium]|nr:hypothetical protein [Fibrobacterota bacterium]